MRVPQAVEVTSNASIQMPLANMEGFEVNSLVHVPAFYECMLHLGLH